MPKKYQTSIEIDAQTKGFDAAQQKAAKLNASIGRDVNAQTKGFAEAQKTSAAFDKSLERLGKTFGGTSGEFKKHIQSVMKEFGNLDKMDLKDVRKQIDGLQGNLTDLYKEQEAVSAAMEGMTDKADPAYEKLKGHLKTVQEESRKVERRIGSMTKAYSQQFKESDRAAKAAAKLAEEQSRMQQQSKGAFTQGLAQGGLPFPAPFLQRGPGMGRQVAGMAIGKAATGGLRGGRAMGAGMFGGTQGLGQALSALPGGGVIAGQFMTAASYAQQNIQWQKQKLGLSPYIEGVEDMFGRRQAQMRRSKKLRTASKKQEQAEFGLSELQDYQRLYREEAERLDRRQDRGVVGGIVDTALGREESEKERYARIMAESFIKTAEEGKKRKGGDVILADPRKGTAYQTADEYRKAADKLQEHIDTAGKAFASATKEVSNATRNVSKKFGMGPFQDVGRMGSALMGVAKPEAAQFVGGLVQAGGGFTGEARSQDMLGTSMAAKTLFGVGPETSGAFLRAGRRGGMVGAMGEGGAAYKEVLSEGLKMGLEGSEMTTYIQQMAQGIQRFESTGIPINPRSVTALAGDLSRAGIAGTRALAMSQGMAGGLQQIGQRGVRGGLDQIMLQLLGDYKGGGAKDYRAARSRMEELGGTVAGGGVEGVAGNSKITGALKRYMGFVGGGEGVQAEMLQRAMEQMGVRGSVKEFDWLARSIRGGEAGPEQLEAIRREEGRIGKGYEREEGIREKGGYERTARMAVGTYGPGARAQANLTNRQIAAGRKMVGVVMKLENMAINTTNAFNKLTGEPLQKAIDGLDVLAQKAFAAADKIVSWGNSDGPIG